MLTLDQFDGCEIPDDFTPLGATFPQLKAAWEANKMLLLAVVKQLANQFPNKRIEDFQRGTSYNPGRARLDRMLRHTPHIFSEINNDSFGNSFNKSNGRHEEGQILTTMEAMFGPYYKVDGDVKDYVAYVPIVFVDVEENAKTGVQTAINFSSNQRSSSSIKLSISWLGIFRSSSHSIEVSTSFKSMQGAFQIALPVRLRFQGYENHYNGDKRYTARVLGVDAPIRSLPSSREYTALRPLEQPLSPVRFMGWAEGGKLTEAFQRGEGFSATASPRVPVIKNFELQYRSEATQTIEVIFTSDSQDGLFWQKWENSKGLYKFSR